MAQTALDTTLTELNSSGTKLNLILTGYWEKFLIDAATMKFTQTKPNIRIDLGLTSAILTGRFDYKIDLSFTSPTNNSFIGSIFKEEIEDHIEDEIMNRLLNYVDLEFDREVKNKSGVYIQNCSGRQLGSTHIGVSCDIDAQLTLNPGSL